MRVALISYHAFLNPGGVKRHVLGLHKEFKRREIYCKIIAPRRSFKEEYDKDIILLGTSFPLPLLGSISDFDVNFNTLAIERVLEKEKFDVLHFHNFGPSSVQIVQQSQVLNILTFHSNPRGSKLLMKFPIILKTLETIANWKLDGVIGVAPLSLKFFKKYRGPKIVIPNGIDLEDFNPKVPKIKKFLDKKLNIVYVGRIEKRKGLIYLLRAYNILQKKYNNLRIIAVGDGAEMKQKCQNYVKEHNLKEVHFVGAKHGQELVSYYNTADIFVSPSIFGESFGLVLLEAMACQKAVAAFGNQGYRELLAGKASARFLAKPRDFKELANKIEILIRNEKLRDEMGKQNLKDAQDYSWKKVADKILKFYELCKKEKQKREKPSFSLQEQFDKLIEKAEKILNL